MKKNIVGDLIVFFKRKFLIIFLTVLAGNLLSYFSYKNTKPIYRGVISVYVKSVYYDPLRKMLDELTGTNNSTVFKNIPSGIKYNYSSYRNEDVYIFDVNIDASDTTEVGKGVKYAQKIIGENNALEATYYNNMKLVNELYSDADSLYEFAFTNKSKLYRKDMDGKYDIRPEIMLLDLKNRKFNFKRMLNDIQRDLKIIYPQQNSYTYQTLNKFKKHLVATVFSFAIGIFLAIFFEQVMLLKNAPKNDS